MIIIARMIKTLQGYNCIRRVGSNKMGHWEIVNQEVQARISLKSSTIYRSLHT